MFFLKLIYMSKEQEMLKSLQKEEKEMLGMKTEIEEKCKSKSKEIFESKTRISEEKTKARDLNEYGSCLDQMIKEFKMKLYINMHDLETVRWNTKEIKAELKELKTEIKKIIETNKTYVKENEKFDKKCSDLENDYSIYFDQ